MKNYIPEYADGKILVGFLSKIFPTPDTAKSIGLALGFELDKEYDQTTGIYIFNVPVGKEDDACKIFKNENKLVEWSERYDLKLEKRNRGVDNVISMTQSLRDKTQNDDDYKKFIKDIIKAIKSLE